MRRLCTLTLGLVLAAALAGTARAEDKDSQLRAYFTAGGVVIVADATLPSARAQTTIAGLQDAGHREFSLTTTADGLKKNPSMQIRWLRRDAEIDASEGVDSGDITKVVAHLTKSGVQKVRFAHAAK